MATNDLPLVVDDQIDVDRACDQIGAAWHTTIDSLFQIVGLFRECLGKKGFKQLKMTLEERGIMKSSVFSMFKSIAENPAFDLKVKDHLPPAYNTLYQLSFIEDLQEFKRLISAGEINRDTDLEGAKKLKNNFLGISQEEYDKTKPTPSIMPIASIKIRREEFRKNKKRIFQLLDELEGLGLIIKRSEELE
jgi:hypothetical protein